MGGSLVADEGHVQFSQDSYQNNSQLIQQSTQRFGRGCIIPDSDDDSTTDAEFEDEIPVLSQSSIDSQIDWGSHHDIIVQSAPKSTAFALLISHSNVESAEGRARLSGVDFSKALDRSYLSLIDAIYNTELANGNTKGHDIFMWRSRLRPLFAIVPLTVLRHALDGSLTYRDLSRIDLEIVKHCHAHSKWTARTLAEFAPAINIRSFVDQKGDSPTPNEFLAVVRALRDYASGRGLEMALSIGTAFQTGQHQSDLKGLKKGHHRYLEASQDRVMKIFTWCAAIIKVCNAVPKQR